MPQSVHESIIGLPDYKIISYQGTKTVEILAEYTGLIGCIHCGSVNLRKKERFDRVFKHKFWGYCMLVRHIQESGGRIYGNKRFFGRRELRNVFLGAAENVMRLDGE